MTASRSLATGTTPTIDRTESDESVGRTVPPTSESGGSDPGVDDDIKATDKGLLPEAESETDSGGGSEPGTSDAGKSDKGL